MQPLLISGNFASSLRNLESHPSEIRGTFPIAVLYFYCDHVAGLELIVNVWESWFPDTKFAVNGKGDTFTLLPYFRDTFCQVRLVSYKRGSCVLCPSFSHPLKRSQFLPCDRPHPPFHETYPLGGDAGTSLELLTCIEFLESRTVFAARRRLSNGDGKGWVAPAFRSLEALIGSLFSFPWSSLRWTSHASVRFDANRPAGSKVTERDGQTGIAQLPAPHFVRKWGGKDSYSQFMWTLEKK